MMALWVVSRREPVEEAMSPLERMLMASSMEVVTRCS